MNHPMISAQQTTSSPVRRNPNPRRKDTLLGGGRVLGDGLCTFRNGVLGEFTWQDQSYGCLDLSRRDGRLLVVCGKLGGLSGDALEDVVDEGVEDGHGTVGDTSVRVDLLEHLVDVGRIGLLPGLGALLLLARWGGSLLASLLLLGWGLTTSWGLAAGRGSLGCCFWCHCAKCVSLSLKSRLKWIGRWVGKVG